MRKGIAIAGDPFSGLFGNRAWAVLESQFAVRRLAAALPARTFFVLQHEVDRRGGNCLADEAAADARAERTVPVALNDHRSVTSGTYSGKCCLHHFVLTFHPALRDL